MRKLYDLPKYALLRLRLIIIEAAIGLEFKYLTYIVFYAYIPIMNKQRQKREKIARESILSLSLINKESTK
tara:strand:- start:436 stop:648 length:213 start_codon:yes stop_codon:yes gene_type:complete